MRVAQRQAGRGLRAALAGPLRGLAGALAVLCLGLAPGASAQEEPPPLPAEPTPADGLEPAPEDLAPGATDAAPLLDAAPTPEEPAYASEIERVWFEPAMGLRERVDATRRASLEYGVWNLEAAARAVLYGGYEADPMQRAVAAVRLAPDLPAARMELARSLWLQEEAPFAALRTAWEAVMATPRHIEASLWFAGWGLSLAAFALVGGGLLAIWTSGLFAAPHAAHDLGDLLPGRAPAYARAGLLACLLALPWMLGEGLLGTSWVLLALALVYARTWRRVVLAMAASAVLAGAFPLAGLAGSVLGGLASDPVAEAAYSVASGSSLETDLVRLEAAAADDAFAARALARRARRTRSLSVADAHYQALLEQSPGDLVIANNAANVRLNLGHMETALDLYAQAIEIEESAIVLYNLAQAYGRAFQVEDLAETLARAQALDGPALAELTQLQGEDPVGFVVDLPLPTGLVWKRLAGSPAGEAVAREARAWIAPGWLGRDLRRAAGASAVWLLLAWGVGSRVHGSGWCPRCGRRMCRRCDPEGAGGRLCGACMRLFHQSGETDRALRTERIEALRAREARVEKLVWATSIALPGAAGLLAKRPLATLLGPLFFVLAACALLFRNGVMPDPLVAGAAAPFLALHVAGVAGLAYAIVVATCLAARGRL